MFALPLLLSTLTAHAAEKPTILVFTSDSDAATSAIVDRYKTDTGFAIRRTYDLGGIDHPGEFIADNLRDTEPALIFALGELALKESARAWPNVPVIAAEVSATAMQRLGRSDIVSVSSRVNPVLAAERLATVFPRARAVSVIRRPDDADPWWPLFESALVANGLSLHLTEASTPDEVQAVTREALFRADLLVLAEDPALWTAVGLRDTFEQARAHHIPVVTWDPLHLGAEAPPALAFHADQQSIATTAAKISEQIVMNGADTAAVTTTYPAPVVVGDRAAMLDTHAPLGHRVVAAVDEWHSEEDAP